MPIFTKPPNIRIHYVEISCTEFYPNRAKIVEILAKFHSRLQEKYSLLYIHFHETHQWPKILSENLTENGAQIWKVGYKIFHAPKYNTTVTEPTFTKLKIFLHFFNKLYTEFHENLTNSLVVDRPTTKKKSYKEISYIYVKDAKSPSCAWVW
jgi:hypothetical protein